jgi:hypothetical protein
MYWYINNIHALFYNTESTLQGRTEQISDGSRDRIYYIYIITVLKIHWYGCEITLFPGGTE